MSDYSGDEENNFDYENCIPKRTRDTDTDDSSSDFSLHLDNASKIPNSKAKYVQDDEDNWISNHKAKFVQGGEDNEISNAKAEPVQNECTDFSLAQLEDFEFNPGDAYVFLLGMMNRIQDYLKKQDKGDEWLKKHIDITKTVLIKSSYLFQVIEVVDINGTVYIKNHDPTKKETDTDVEKPVINVSEPPVQSEVDILEQEVVMASEDSKNNVASNHKHSEPTNGPKPKQKSLRHSINNLISNRRQSQRLQKNPQEEKGSCTDRLTKVALKLEQYHTSTPEAVGASTSSKPKKKSQNLVRNVFAKSVDKNKKPTRNSSVGLQSIEEEGEEGNNKKTTQRKNKSLGANENNNVKCSPSVSGLDPKKQKDTKVKSNKRRAVSLGGGAKQVNKKAKLNETDPEQPSGTLRNTSSAKRTLYSEDNWLHTFNSFMINTPPST